MLKYVNSAAIKGGDEKEATGLEGRSLILQTGMGVGKQTRRILKK